MTQAPGIHVGTVLSVEQIAQGMSLIRFNAPTLASVARPGQLVLIGTGAPKGSHGGAQTFDQEPYPLRSFDTSTGDVTLLSISDDGGSRVPPVEGHTDLFLFGPLGKPVEINPAAQHIVFLAQGAGIAALLAVLSAAARNGARVTLLAGAENAWRLYPSTLLPDGVREMTATDDGSAGIRAPVTHLLPQLQGDADLLIASGPAQLYQDLARMRSDGLLTMPTMVMLLPPMECGTGECGRCAIQTNDGPRLACVDGPAFDPDQLSAF